MDVIHRFSVSDEQGKQLYRYFNGNEEWVEKWEKNDDATRMIMANSIQELESIREQVLAEQISPLAYHLQANILDVKCLSSYTGISKRNIRKHLKPKYFNQLDDETLKRYATVFEISVDELKNV